MDFSHETVGGEMGVRRPSQRQTEKSKFTWFQIYTPTFFFLLVSQLWLGIYSWPCFTAQPPPTTTTTEHWRLCTFTDQTFLEFLFFHSAIPFPFLGRPFFFLSHLMYSTCLDLGSFPSFLHTGSEQENSGVCLCVYNHMLCTLHTHHIQHELGV